jgi:nanoRNase/pAp phosphatase (c-di-AMP/oligoRNAs hydrolase)
LGKNAHILRNPEMTEKYAFLHEGLTKESVEDGEILIAVDTASAGMLPEAFAPYADRITLRIDHHGKDRGFTPLSLIDSESASCAELIWDLF